MGVMKGVKLLVANRSEIACRIFQAAREMGIPTVAIVAPGDEAARHVTFADEVLTVPSYLDADAIVNTAKKAGVTLIHPGYGFLSERSHFVTAVEKAGMTFIGPTAETMQLMGGKIQAKEIAEKAGVPTLPWAKVPKGGDLREAAKKVGFPLLLKAAAGGGGKGMRRVDRAEDLDLMAESAAAEAVSAFGDGTLFLERLLVSPRHIEVQVFGDGRGNAVHLFERECSLQRRHQKVWEEARAPHLSEATRKTLFDSALSLTREVKYRSAGTLEYLVDDQGHCYFLEMNTRLQVEHPVTEFVTGVDLVHAQIEQALNPLRFVFETAPTARGHAIEVRLYTEDPSMGYRPTPGRIDRLRWPTGPGVRVDSGIEEGQEIGTLFDSMLAKLIVYGSTRAQAVSRLRRALDETVILGVNGFSHNQAFLRALCDHPAVIEGKVDTGFLERDFGKWKPEVTDEIASLLSAAKAGGVFKGSGGAAPLSGSSASEFASPWFSVKGGV